MPRTRSSTSGASVHVFQVWHVSLATPGLLNVCSCELAEVRLHAVLFYLFGLEDQFSAVEDYVVHLHVYTFGSPQCDISRFRGK